MFFVFFAAKRSRHWRADNLQPLSAFWVFTWLLSSVTLVCEDCIKGTCSSGYCNILTNIHYSSLLYMNRIYATTKPFTKYMSGFNDIHYWFMLLYLTVHGRTHYCTQYLNCKLSFQLAEWPIHKMRPNFVKYLNLKACSKMMWWRDFKER